MIEIPAQYAKHIYKILIVFLVILTLFFAVKILGVWREYRIAGLSDARTISLSGHGEVNAAPDIANIYFTISKDGKTVKEAQDAVATIEKAALDVLSKNNIATKDIKTSNASFYPKYEYVYSKAAAPCNEWGCPPRPGNNVIVGYTSSESITVKVRNIDDSGKIMQELGTTGVSDLSGPNFDIDDTDALQAEARKEAINDAKDKANILAKDLGVKLGKIVSFGENSGGGYPILYSAKAEMSADMAAGAPAPAVLPQGENTISSDVTITFEIR